MRAIAYSTLFTARGLLIGLPLSGLLAGCAGQDIQRPLIGSTAEPLCQAPSGLYANFGSTFADQATPVPALSSLLWEGDAPTVGIDSLKLETLENGNLKITPRVAGREVEGAMELTPGGRNCADGRWRFTTSWDGLLLDGVVSGLFWTGGMFLPAAQRDEYTILFTDAGELTVHYVGRLAGTFFVFFPLYMKDREIWFVYPQITPAAPDAPAQLEPSLP